MVEVRKSVVIPVVTCLVAVACTSAIWVGAYYIGIKDDDTVIVVYPTNAPEQSTTKLEQSTRKPEQSTTKESSKTDECLSPCEFYLVESIPELLTYNVTPKFMSTTDAWLKLLDLATSTIDIASYYWTLKREDTGGYADDSAKSGESIFEGLVYAAQNKSVKIRVTQNAQDNPETAFLSRNGLASVRSLNFTDFLGSGILHTKAWIVDGKHLYIGSANIDWRSLTQVKELGVAAYNCPCLAQDMAKMMEVYWEMGAPNKKLPSSWPSRLDTVYNEMNPMSVRLNAQQSAVFFSSAPPPFCPVGREDDIGAILNVINTAKKFIHISVMDYIPAIIYGKNNNRYWSDIDNALRTAAYRYVEVKLLISKWRSTKKYMYPYLFSLTDIDSALPCIYKNNAAGHRECVQKGSIEVRLFQVPAYGNQSQIPFSRVNHNKYMVTENALYIGTSNWSGDYFVYTGGFGITIQSDDVMQHSSIVTEANENIFLRDWNSNYSKPLSDFDIHGNPIR